MKPNYRKHFNSFIQGLPQKHDNAVSAVPKLQAKNKETHTEL